MIIMQAPPPAAQSVWSTVLTLIVPAFSAGVAALALWFNNKLGKRVVAISDAQVKVAAVKLRLDTFDKRFGIWEKIDAGIDEQSAIISKQSAEDFHVGDFNIDGLRKVWQGKKEAKFAFGVEVLDQIKVVEDSLQTFQNASATYFREPDMSQIIKRELSLKRAEAKRALIKDQQWLVDVMKPYLDLSDARSGTVDLEKRRRFRESIQGLGKTAGKRGFAGEDEST